MNSGKLNYVVVGIFVLAAIVGTLVVLALLTGRTGATDGYYAVYRNVTGIKFGTQVLYEGYPIGQVEDVSPQPADDGMRFRVDFSVTEGWRIPRDSVAQIATSGLLAAVSINISSGADPEALRPGSQIAAREAANVFAVVSSLARDVGQLADEGVRPLLDTISETFGAANELLAGDGRVLTAELSNLARLLSQRAPAIIDDIETFTTTMNETGENLRLLVRAENRQKIENLVDNLDKAAENLTTLSGKLDRLATSLNDVVDDNRANLDQSIADLRYIMDALSRDIDSINQNLEGTSRNMYEFSRQIRKNPGVLLGGTTPSDPQGR